MLAALEERWPSANEIGVGEEMHAKSPRAADVVISRGLRYTVVRQEGTRLCVVPFGQRRMPGQWVVTIGDPDLILAPTGEDLAMAAAYERGEVNAFEYADGRTYPPNREIKQDGTDKPH